MLKPWTLMLAVTMVAIPRAGDAQSTEASTQLQLNGDAINILKSETNKPLVAELSFDLETSPTAKRPEGAIRVIIGDNKTNIPAEDRTVGLISLGGTHAEDYKPVRHQKTLIELTQALKGMNLAEFMNTKCIPITLSVEEVPPDQPKVAIKNLSVRLTN